MTTPTQHTLTFASFVQKRRCAITSKVSSGAVKFSNALERATVKTQLRAMTVVAALNRLRFVLPTHFGPLTRWHAVRRTFGAIEVVNRIEVVEKMAVEFVPKGRGLCAKLDRYRLT